MKGLHLQGERIYNCQTVCLTVVRFEPTLTYLLTYCNLHLYVDGSLVVLSNTLSWWRHQMGTFSALLALCAANSPVIGEFPAQKPVTRSLDVFFDLRPNKRSSKQSSGWWFETPLCSLSRNCNDKGRQECYKNATPMVWPIRFRREPAMCRFNV